MRLSFSRLSRLIVVVAAAALLSSGCYDLGLDTGLTGVSVDRDPTIDATSDTRTKVRGPRGKKIGHAGSGTVTEEPDVVAPSPTPSETEDADPVAPDGSSAPPELASAHYGPRDLSCPSGATLVEPGDSVQQVIDEAGEDATVCVTRGVHRLTRALRPKWGSTLVFETGAVLNGSRPVAEWRSTSGHWIATGQSQSIESSSGRCTENPVACEYEDLFFDGTPLTRVLDRSELRSGTFYFDEANDQIHLADDPTGHVIEATVAETAIDAGGAQDITVRNATIEKFGKHAVVTSGGWLVADNEIRYVHSHGLRVFGSSRVEGNHIHHTGNMGILADEGDGLVFTGNQLDHNNYLGFDLWHAGATKITGSRGTVVRNNWSHHNTGDGWWFDWDNIDSVVEGNVFEKNTRFGFLYEASFAAHIAGNTFRRNGTTDGDGSGGGLWLNTSRDVEVASNVFEFNVTRSLALASTDRGTSSSYGNRETANLHVHDNTFMLTEGYVGMAYGTTDVYTTAANNRFTDNAYLVPAVQRTWWRWGKESADQHTAHTWEEWNAAGQDRTGSVSTLP